MQFEEKTAWHSSSLFICSCDAFSTCACHLLWTEHTCNHAKLDKLRGKGGNIHARRACEGPFRSSASVVKKWVIVLWCYAGSRCSRGASSEILKYPIRCHDLCHLRVGVMTELHCAWVLWVIGFCGYFLCGLFSRLSQSKWKIKQSLRIPYSCNDSYPFPHQIMQQKQLQLSHFQQNNIHLSRNGSWLCPEM